MTSKESSVLFQSIQQAQRKYEATKGIPVDPMPGRLAFEQGYLTGFQDALEYIAKDLKVALKSLVNDAHCGEDNLWRIGPFDNSPDSRLGYARQVISD